jgi:iron complex outermembrane receptor protein
VDLGALRLATGGEAVPAVAGTAGTAGAGEAVDQRHYESLTVTARRVEEDIQDVPLPVSVVTGPVIERAGAFNVNRLKELVPTVQFYSSNPRNSSITIRGLGSPFGLTNDGIDAGVGFYVDGVFFARTAAATLDFLDLERVEILRGPQGTLFGKNTTAGAINITTRRPTFTPEQNYELTFGNYGFVQAKASFSGPVYKDKVAARLSFSGTQRDGLLYNTRTQDDVNDLNNLGVRAQVLILARHNLSILLSADYSRQRPEGYAQVIAGVAPTLRPLNRQWASMIADLNYQPTSYNAFDRVLDTDSPWRSNQDLGGGSLTVDWDSGRGMVTAITAWRFWDWNPSNDRDFIGMPVTTISAAPSKQRQFTQEIRYTGTLTSRANFLVGAFTFNQDLRPDGFHTQQQGAAAARFLLAPSANANTPGLLDGYGQNIGFNYDNSSNAVFGQVEYSLTEHLKVIPGLRYNFDRKTIDYKQTVYGGLQTSDPALLALKRSILAPMAYTADASDHNLSGQLTLSYKTSKASTAYATFSTGFKPIGLNLGGVPQDAAGNPIASAAIVRPERVRHWELGIKSNPLKGVTANLSLFETGVRDYQTQVVNSQVGVLRGYLANAERVRVRGIELDASARLNPELSFYTSIAFTDGRYSSFRDAPPPLEETGGPQVKDISGSVLPGISKWAFSVGGEYVKRGSFLTLPGEWYARLDASHRSRFSSNASPSRYLTIDPYGLLNPKVGFRSRDGWEVSVWARNLANANYYEFLSAAPGNSGMYVGLPGDQRTYGITLKRSLRGSVN